MCFFFVIKQLKYDTWCSSGALDINGRLISTGGYNNGSDTVRVLDINPNSEWVEYPGALGNGRWYATQITLADGRFMVFGGRNFPTYEFVPEEGKINGPNKVIDFKFLAETHDRSCREQFVPIRLPINRWKPLRLCQQSLNSA